MSRDRAVSKAGPGTVLVVHPSSDLYGSDRMLLESVRGLVEHGWRVVAAIPGDGPLLAELEAVGAVVVGCPTLVLRKSLMRVTAVTRLLTSALANAVGGARLIHGTRPDAIYVNTITVPVWVVLGRAFAKPVVVHVHEAETSLSRVVRTLLTSPLLLAHSIVSNSNYTTEAFCALFPSLRRKVSLVYNGVHPGQLIAPPRADLQNSLKMLYVGRLSERKGIDVAISAVALARRSGIDVSLDVVGSVLSGNETYQDVLEQHVDNLGIDGAVFFHGFDANIWPHLSRADAAIVPARQVESFGNTVIEALMAGRPVIVSNTSGLREAAADYDSAVLIEPGNVREAAAAIVELTNTWLYRRNQAMKDSQICAIKHSPENFRASVAAVVAGTIQRLQSDRGLPLGPMPSSSAGQGHDYGPHCQWRP